ncbi:MAG: shikimate dehydrogenase [Balneolaceae bacterium]|nr:shikimate dehydrogenase [Balneolaceae bacterium]
MNLTEFKRSDKSKNPHFLLFGNPVDHSLSPVMHNTAAKSLGIETKYHAIALRPDELSSVSAHLNSEQFKGANITIPYKHMLMQYMDELSIVAEDIGAINTIVKENGRLIGDNTDIYGFTVPLRPVRDELYNTEAIVFGTGGATKAIIYALFDLGINQITVISREPAGKDYFNEYDNVGIEGYGAWTSFADDSAIIINATPLGMNPKEDESPVRDSEIEVLQGKICYDIVYNPLKTKFLKQAEEVGARTIGGLEMLIHQGSKSFELWTGKQFPIDEIKQTLHEFFE